MLHGNKVAARAKCQLAKEIMVSNVLMNNSIGTACKRWKETQNGGDHSMSVEGHIINVDSLVGQRN